MRGGSFGIRNIPRLESQRSEKWGTKRAAVAKAKIPVVAGQGRCLVRTSSVGNLASGLIEPGKEGARSGAAAGGARVGARQKGRGKTAVKRDGAGGFRRCD